MGDAASCVCAGERDAVASMSASDTAHGEHVSSPRRPGFKGGTPRQAPMSARSFLSQGSPKSLRAKANLRTICEEEHADPASIQQALESACASGIAAFELAEATEAAQRPARRREAREALSGAMSSREEDDLRKALTMADEAALDHREVEGAIKLIEQLERSSADGGAASQRARAVARLEQAVKSRGRKELEEAIAGAESAGLGAKNQRAVLAEARVLLKMVKARHEVAQERRALEERRYQGEVVGAFGGR
mmetsp:Transcript_11477/g.40848  ORF Transcript_11477/g.40848 Transcript_11477/m.40848 type:complete len:251 (+) Transcript_11477:108-860(+)